MPKTTTFHIFAYSYVHCAKMQKKRHLQSVKDDGRMFQRSAKKLEILQETNFCFYSEKDFSFVCIFHDYP